MQGILLISFLLLLGSALYLWYRQTYPKSQNYFESPSYLKRGSLLVDYERSYFTALSQAIGSHAYIFPKVRLSALLQPLGSQPEQRTHWARVQRRCVDFLLCSPGSLTPVLAIDLDSRAKRRKRESAPTGRDVLDDALLAADIPLLRVRADREYDPREIMQQIRLTLAKSREPVSELFVNQEQTSRLWDRLKSKHLPAFEGWVSEALNTLRSKLRVLGPHGS